MTPEGTTGLEEERAEAASLESRRRLQNRLNQRESRRRKKEQQQQQQQQQHERNQFIKWVFYLDPRAGERQQQKQHRQRALQIRPESADTREGSGSDTTVDGNNRYNAGFPDIFPPKKHRYETVRFFCHMKRDERSAFFHQLYDLVSRSVAQHTLDCQLLPSVMQFNVIRAATINASSIGLALETISEDSISPFYDGGVSPCLLPAPPPCDEAGAGDKWENIPPNLQPTALQRQIVHHPWIDICPQPGLRDALLRRLGDLDEDEFCHHMFLQSGQSDDGGMIGMVVWGEAWDPTSYEISAAMVRKWPWLADECPDMIATTNYWRGRRREKPLKVLS
ncbi:abhydrolase domain-containing [Trichoderma cornu-damae]|uniref:Abhydrolase domain-containing n=1 Tax=Trichoderma cornu-damae TaxID=654480 RepID=A0A9P8U0C1_9HYPO|nr:abhydrolase domain-containing [Trichoderma cornu-damae]